MSSIDRLVEINRRLVEVFYKDSECPVPPDEMCFKSHPNDLIDSVEAGLKGLKTHSSVDDVVNLLDSENVLVVSGPIMDDYIGLYAGIVHGYDPSKGSLLVTYINVEGDTWEGEIGRNASPEDNKAVKYKWGTVKLPQS